MNRNQAQSATHSTDSADNSGRRRKSQRLCPSNARLAKSGLSTSAGTSCGRPSINAFQPASRAD